MDKILKRKFFGKKKHARNSRSSETFVDNKGKFHRTPQYEGHLPSTHLMEDDNRRTAWPSITEKKDGTGYKNQRESQALKAGESYGFLFKNNAKKFAKGSWKPGEEGKQVVRDYKAEKKIERAKSKSPKRLEKVNKKYGYDESGAVAAGLGPDETGHWPSRDPITGRIFKGKKHPTFHKTKKAEKEAGYKIYKKGGNLYSKLRKNK